MYPSLGRIAGPFALLGPDCKAVLKCLNPRRSSTGKLQPTRPLSPSITMTEVMTETLSHISLSSQLPTVYCLINHEDPLVQPLIEAAFRSRLSNSFYKIIRSLDEYPGGPLLQIGAKDALDLDKAFHQPRMLISTYVTRDALTRKHLLGQTYANWIVKHPTSLLKTNVKTITNLDFGPSESLYDVLDNTKIGEILQANEDKKPANRVWWMLRPDMSGGSQDLRLFSTVDELEATFEEWDAEPAETNHEAKESTDVVHEKSSSTPNDDEDCDTSARQSGGGWSSWFNITVTTEEHTDEAAPRRHVVAQRYVTRPLTFDNRKFQVSAYVLAVGALRVFVYKPMLALFAAAPFRAPWETAAAGNDLSSHSTFEGSVRQFWDLPDKPAGWKATVFAQICDITGEVFSAAATREMKAHFQLLPQAFEVYSVNFAVDCTGKAILADIHASPDFLHQTECGAKLEGMVQGLYEEVADIAVKPFYEGEGAGACSDRLVKVADLDATQV